MAAAAAEATPPDRASDDETLLHCSVCQENFHPKSRLPRSLPCHHSFCGDCIDKLEQDSQVKCPMCRKVAKVEGPFPVDDTHITYLELRLPAQTEEAPPCEDCPDKEKAAFHCQDCSANFCDACCKAHKRVKASRNHTIIELSEIAQNPDLRKLAPEKCDIHKDRPFEFFCKTCDKPVCAACAAMLHRDGHNIADLEDTKKTWKQKVNSENEEFSEAIEALEVKAASLKTILEHMDTDHNHAIEDIEKTFVELQTALNVRKATLLADLGAKVKANRLALEEELATVESQISSSKATRDYNQRLVQYGLPSQLAAHMTDLNNPAMLQEAKQVTEALTPARPIGLDRKGLQQIKTAIETFGTIFDDAIIWTLEDVEKLTETGTLSDAGYFCDGKWTIKAATTKGHRHLSLYFRFAAAEKLWAFRVHLALKILNFRSDVRAKCLRGPALVNARDVGIGWKDFITFNEATNPTKGFVKDGKMCIQGSFELDLSKGLVAEEVGDKSE